MHFYSKVHILGSFKNIRIARNAICSLIMGKGREGRGSREGGGRGSREGGGRGSREGGGRGGDLERGEGGDLERGEGREGI